ncbi:Major pollen allergen Bet v 1-M/N [Hibiscus syriacus]|uniref:Major pollen allergen Bet v 1-M/N n=1 Tax=Hibiscus syriacus TaxID=106335 RepID=A0A6A2Z2H0_HIBSY|nr:Major pollen allergen Bet v 1-M/N [Hibiscus syriacus]
MGVFTYKSEVITAIPPAKMFKTCILDGDNLIPKVVPQAFKSVEYIQGNGEPGSIKKVTFGEGSQFKYMKQKVEALDEENFAYTYSVIEGRCVDGQARENHLRDEARGLSRWGIRMQD